MSIEGKIVNQFPKQYDNPLCERCNEKIASPQPTSLKVTNCEIESENSYLGIWSYLFTPYFIYESKSGFAVCYCSKYCRDKHNHRFTKPKYTAMLIV